MRWETERTKEFECWWDTLTAAEQLQLAAPIEVLETTGPGTGRPFVDSIRGSRHPNMKELRANGTLRIFFAFDPKRVAILLIGGDKAGRVRRFYRQMIPKADKIYDAHLLRVRKGGSHER